MKRYSHVALDIQTQNSVVLQVSPNTRSFRRRFLIVLFVRNGLLFLDERIIELLQQFMTRANASFFSLTPLQKKNT
jgi:hypothetical protein